MSDPLELNVAVRLLRKAERHLEQLIYHMGRTAKLSVDAMVESEVDRENSCLLHVLETVGTIELRTGYLLVDRGEVLKAIDAVSFHRSEVDRARVAWDAPSGI